MSGICLLTPSWFLKYVPLEGRKWRRPSLLRTNFLWLEENKLGWKWLQQSLFMQETCSGANTESPALAPATSHTIHATLVKYLWQQPSPRNLIHPAPLCRYRYLLSDQAVKNSMIYKSQALIDINHVFQCE